MIFTTLKDDDYGAGGTFDTSNDADRSSPGPGRWGGIIFNATSSGSFDHGPVTYAGGRTPIEGNFDQFNTVEIHQADVRIANSTFTKNAAGLADTDRNGRGTNAAATVFVRGAQPVIVQNVIRDNAGAMLSIDANAMKANVVPDCGRSTG